MTAQRTHDRAGRLERLAAEKPHRVVIHTLGCKRDWGRYRTAEEADEQVRKLRGYGFDARKISPA